MNEKLRNFNCIKEFETVAGAAGVCLQIFGEEFLLQEIFPCGWMVANTS